MLSPLFSLPPEIRIQILRELLGNRIIHIVWPKLGHYLCDGGPTFDEDYKQFMEGELPVALSEGYTNCWLRGSTDPQTEPPKLDLRVLRTCRQLYNECNSILWTTNTFEFDNASIFADFMAGRSPGQKSLFRRLQLSIEEHLWDSTLSTTLTQSLSGLRELYLTFDYARNKHFVRSVSNNEISTHDIPLFMFRTLPLARVHVIIPGEFGGHSPPESGFACSTEDRRKVARHVEKLLLGSKGPEGMPRTGTFTL